MLAASKMYSGFVCSYDGQNIVKTNSFSRFGSIARNCCLNGMNIHHVVSQVVKWAVFRSRDSDLNLAPFWSFFVSSCEALSQFTSTFMLINL